MKMRSNKDFLIFEKEVLFWIDYFKLYNWYVRILFKLDDVDKDAFSYISHKDHMALICLNKQKVNEIDIENEEELKLAAFHEVCEVLLYPLRVLGEEVYSENVLIKNTHIIIHHLENSVFKNEQIKRNANKTRRKEK